jgi:hypothetical protein
MNQRSIKVPIVLITMAWLFTMCSLYLEYLYGQNLFSRSGAMMVLFSMIAEYNLLAVRDNYHNEKLQLLSKGEKINFKKIHPKKSHQYLETIAHITVITGTIIWGYGDLL